MSTLSPEALARVQAAATSAERAERLRAALGVRRYEANAAARARVDLLLGALRFAADDARLGGGAAPRLLAAADELLAAAVATADADADAGADTGAGTDTAARAFGVLAERLRADRWPPAEAARAVDFLGAAVLRHLRAHRRVASAARASVAELAPLAVETPLPPPPLAAAASTPVAPAAAPALAASASDASVASAADARE